MYQWDKISKEYSCGNYTKKSTHIPGLLDNVVREKGQRMLDLGCGDGIIGKIFFDEGLDVVGVDNSKEFIELAKSKNSGPSYFHEDGTTYRAQQLFDIIISNMVVCNLPDIQTVNNFFKSCYENLKSGGKAYITHQATEFQKRMMMVL